ncbi:MAG: hypothetical protein AAFR69_00485 [Pseudomonadota bacterium]
MAWRFWSVAGEALHFGARRMETIMRVGWLPVLFILVIQMASVFLTLSLATDRAVSIATTGGFAAAKAALPIYQTVLLVTKPLTFLALTLSTQGLTLLMIAVFVVPLTRDAATGERPDPGVMRFACGPQQVRYVTGSLAAGLVPVLLVLLPVLIGFQTMIGLLAERLQSDGWVLFPSEQSLHTVRPAQTIDVLAGPASLYWGGVAMPLWLFALPVLAVLALLLHRHFQPAHRAVRALGGDEDCARARPWRRLLVIMASMTAFFGLTYGSMIDAYSLPGGLDTAVPSITIPAQIRSVGFILYTVFILLLYVSVRLFPYPGFVVIDRSMALGPTLAATRGWNLFRVLGLMAIIVMVLGLVQMVTAIMVSGFVPMVVTSVYGVLATTTRLLNSGVTADWVVPVLRWTWTLTRLAVSVFMTFFLYGVLAGIYGRLYAAVKAHAPYLPR